MQRRISTGAFPLRCPRDDPPLALGVAQADGSGVGGVVGMNGWPDDDVPLAFGATVALFLAFVVACGLGVVSVLALMGVL